MSRSSNGNSHGLRPRKLILKCSLSPGDVVMLTAAVRDLHTCYAHLFRTDVRTPCPELWENNPYLTPLSEDEPGVEVLECHYPLIDRCDRTPYHCLHGFIEYLNDRLGLAIRPTAFKGDIHLSGLEKSWYSQVRELVGREIPFWIIVAGGKLDYTIKWWETRRYQEVVEHFRGRVQFVQVGDVGHNHPRLEGVIDLRGKTDLRQLVRLVYHAQGVLCPVTCLMHLAAAVEMKPGMPPNRPCVVVAGGREPNHWEAYPHHQFLHTNGALRCCAQGGCWRSRTRPLGDGAEHDQPDSICLDVRGELPRCMDMISASDVIHSIEKYFIGGAVKYLSRAQAEAGEIGVRKTLGNDFDEQLNVMSAEPAVQRFIAQMPETTPEYLGRGIVICGGGFQYFPGVWVTVNMLRQLGCTLPVQVWHLGAKEADAQIKAFTAGLNVQWVDAEGMREEFPARRLNGWELKPYALLHCPFKEVLLLDADNLPVANPEYLFETAEFRATGAVLWPDQELRGAEHPRWRVFGVNPRVEREVESGQVLLDKARCWRALMLCWWYNDHSDYYYAASDGDKGTFPMAFHKLGQAYSMPEKLPHVTSSGLHQHDFEGRRVFQHRCHDKWALFRTNRRDPEFLHEEQCFKFLQTLREHWSREVRPLPVLSQIRTRRNGSIRARGYKRRPQITLVTLYDPSFYELGRISGGRMRHYAQSHGYGFKEYRRLIDPSRSGAWNKILAVRDSLRNGASQWVMWLDADALIMNFDFRIEDLIREDYDLIFGSDFNGLNSAAFLVKNTAWSIRFLDTIYNLGDIDYEMDRWGAKWEQNTIKHVLRNFAGFKEHVALHPEHCMNALEGNYEEGDFILHLGGMSMERRLKAVKERQLESF